MLQFDRKQKDSVKQLSFNKKKKKKDFVQVKAKAGIYQDVRSSLLKKKKKKKFTTDTHVFSAQLFFGCQDYF